MMTPQSWRVLALGQHVGADEDVDWLALCAFPAAGSGRELGRMWPRSWGDCRCRCGGWSGGPPTRARVARVHQSIAMDVAGRVFEGAEESGPCGLQFASQESSFRAGQFAVVGRRVARCGLCRPWSVSTSGSTSCRSFRRSYWLRSTGQAWRSTPWPRPRRRVPRPGSRRQARPPRLGQEAHRFLEVPRRDHLPIEQSSRGKSPRRPRPEATRNA